MAHTKILFLLAVVPVFGLSAWAQDVYVAVGGTGDGSMGNPYGSIQTGINNVGNGGTVFVGPGTFNENLFINGRANFTVKGSGVNQTLLRPGNLNGVLVQLSTGITIEDLHVENLVAQGRGFVALGAELTLNRVSTFNTREEGIITNQLNNMHTILNINDSAIDGSQISAGLVCQGFSTITAVNTSFDGQGTGACGPCPIQFGRGVVVVNNGTINFTNVSADNNADGGMLIDVSSLSSFTWNGGTANDNESNGLFLSGNITTNISNVTFSRNGPEPRDDFNSRNGIEFFRLFTGTGTVTNCFFDSNTINGIFVGSSTLVTVTDSFFLDNRFGITADTDEGATTAVVELYRNTFQVIPPKPDEPAGNLFVGNGLTVTVGGATCANANRYIDIRDMASIFCANSPNLTLGKNRYENSPNPIGQCAGNPNPPPSCGCEFFYDVINNDDIVNLADIQEMAPGWNGAPGVAIDTNGDSFINIMDFVEYASCASTFP